MNNSSAGFMSTLPKKVEEKIDYFRGKPVKLLPGACSLFFKKINDHEYWLTIEKNGGSHIVQWIEIKDKKVIKFHRKLSNRNGIDIANKRRDQELAKYLHNRCKVSNLKIKEFLENAGIYLMDNPHLLMPPVEEYSEVENILKETVVPEISKERKNELIDILKKADLLSYIDEAMYERTPEVGFIIGEVESKHTLNFNCVGAKLGLPTINTLKGDSSIGKTNTANVVTGLHNTKKVGSLSDTALKYAEDMGNVDILYIQETLEEEFKNKETRLMSTDDGGFIAETTINNPLTGKFEVQRTVIPVKTIITTTTAIELDLEFASRSFIIPVDDSEDQTVRILEETFKSTEKKIQELKGEIKFNYKYDDLKEAFQLLKPYIVLIPYEKELMKLFPTNNPRARRDSKKLMQLIKASTLLFQYQRCCGKINNLEVIVASWIDLGHAIFLGGPILEATLTGFDRRLVETLPVIYEIIEEEGYITTSYLQKQLKKSSKYAWKILNFFEDNGYIYHDPATKIAHGIKGKSKVYVKSDGEEYKTLLLAIRNIDWLEIKKIEESFIKKQIPNSSYCVGEVIFLPQYDSRAHNKFVYKSTPIDSEYFRIYNNKKNELEKIQIDNLENLTLQKRISSEIIELCDNIEIDYQNINPVEKAILHELKHLGKHTIFSITEDLETSFNKKEILNTIEDLKLKGWIK